MGSLYVTDLVVFFTRVLSTLLLHYLFSLASQ
jgi:hypothetical protein